MWTSSEPIIAGTTHSWARSWANELGSIWTTWVAEASSSVTGSSSEAPVGRS